MWGFIFCQNKLPILQKQKQIIKELEEEQREYLNEMDKLQEAFQCIRTFSKLKTTFLSYNFIFDWKELYQQLLRQSEKIPRIQLFKSFIIVRALMKSQSEFLSSLDSLADKNDDKVANEVLLNFIALFYIENPKGPQYLVDQLLQVYNKMQSELMIRTIDLEALNTAKNNRNDAIRALTVELETQMRRSEGRAWNKVSLSRYDYLVPLNKQGTSSGELSKYITSISQTMINVFANMFEFLVKMMQMVEVAHTKLIRQYQLLPSGIQLMESEQQLEFIFMVKERVFRNDNPEQEEGKDLRYSVLMGRFFEEVKVFPLEEMRLLGEFFHSKVRNCPMVDLFCESKGYESYFSGLCREFKKNSSWVFEQGLGMVEYCKLLMELEFGSLFKVSAENFITLLLQLKHQLINLMSELYGAKILQEADQKRFKNHLSVEEKRCLTLLDFANYRNVFRNEKQGKQSEDEEERVSLHVDRKSLSTHSNLGLRQMCNQMQLSQIKNLKASIIVQKRKKQVDQEQQKIEKEKEEEKLLTVDAGETRFQERLRSRVKQSRSERSDDDDELQRNDQDKMVSQIQTLYNIQHSASRRRLKHQRIWSEYVGFSDQKSQSTINTQNQLMNQFLSCFSLINIERDVEEGEVE